MAALVKLESLHKEELQKLIRHLTGFEDDDENSELCYKYAMSHLLFNNYPSANKWEVNRILDGIVEKLQFHRLPGRALKLRQLVNKFISLKEERKYGQVDLEWQILHFLLCMAHRPSALKDVPVDDKEPAEPSEVKLLEEEEKEEWSKRLCRGNEKFNSVDDYESDWSSLESEGEIEEVAIASPKEDVNECSTSTRFQYPSLFPKLEPEDKYRTREEYLKHKHEEVIEAKNDLKLRYQHSWWNIDEEIAKVGDNLELTFKDLATSWHPTNDNKLLMVVSEEKVVRELLWTIHCPNSNALFKSDQSGWLEVRQNFTLPTATQETTMVTVSRLSESLQMCQKMTNFRKNLDFASSPFTLLGYANTLTEVLQDFIMEAMALERKLNQTENCVTLLHIEELIKPYNLDFRYVYQIHLKATDKYDIQPRWLTVARLISELEIGLMEATSKRQSDIMLRLLVKSLRVSIDIIDRWLSTGRLEDFRHEFIIFRSGTDRSNEVPYLGAFIVRQPGTKSRILNCLAFSALKAARSMEFALKMNDEFTVFSNTSDTGTMCFEFLSQLGQAISKVFQAENLVNDVMRLEVIKSSLSGFGPDEEYLRDICRFHPLILESMKNSNAEISKRVNDCNAVREAARMNVPMVIKDSYTQHIPELQSGISVFPLNMKIETILESLVTSKHDPASSQLMQHLISDASLLAQLRALHKVFLLESGHTLLRFYNRMFFLAEANLWQSARSLSSLLEDCIERDVGVFSERFEVIPKENVSCVEFPKSLEVCKTMKNIDGIYIKYEVESPVNLVISEDALDSYNYVFRFLAKIEWARWSLQQLRVKDLSNVECSPITHRLFYLRFFLLNTITRIHSYFVRQISGNIFATLENEIIDATSLDAVVEAHKSYLKKLTTHCLENERELQKGFYPYLSICERLKKIWQNQIEGRVSRKEVKKFEEYLSLMHSSLVFCVGVVIDETDSHYSGPLAELLEFLLSNIPNKFEKGV